MHSPKTGPVKRNQQLGSLLVETGVVTDACLNRALVFQQENEGIRMIEALIRTGTLTYREVAAALSSRLGIPFLTLHNVYPTREILAMVPSWISRTYLLLPVLKIEKTLIVAVSDPLYSRMVENLLAIVQVPVRMVVSPEGELAEAVDKYYIGRKIPPVEWPFDSGATSRGEMKEWMWPAGNNNLPEEPKPLNQDTADAACTLFDAVSPYISPVPETSRKASVALFDYSRRKDWQNGKPAVFDTGVEGNDNTHAGEGAATHAEALLFFEKGLAAVKNNAYASALAEFEKSIELDPGNRACSANIQRIKKLLSEKQK